MAKSKGYAREYRASTTMIWTPANRDALNLLGRFRNSDYVIRVSDISGNRTRVRIGEDVSVRFIRRSIVDGARRAARGG